MDKRITIKVGTGVIFENEKLNSYFLRNLAKEVHKLKKENYQILIVSSGAIGLGMKKLSLKKKPNSLKKLQALASTGQVELVKRYEKKFSKYGIKIAQLLLTRYDFAQKFSYINMEKTVNTLLDWGIVPIINENDAVAVEEIKFGDNDILASLIASRMKCSKFIIFTNVDGLYVKGKKVEEIKDINENILSECYGKSKFGTGGMLSKLEAAKIAQSSGVETVITSGKNVIYLSDIIKKKKNLGTTILPSKSLKTRKLWIRYCLKEKGEIVVDKGAEEAILKKGKSLLPSGIKNVKGEFLQGDVILILNEKKKIIGKGITNYSNDEISKIKGKKSQEIGKILGYKKEDEVVHRDNMVVYNE